METVTLSNGVTMPMEGFGVFQIPEEICEQVVKDAISAGYRLIDTASSYQNEKACGKSDSKAVVFPEKNCSLPRKHISSRW